MIAPAPAAHRGREGSQWTRATRAEDRAGRNRYRSEPFASEQMGDLTVITSRLTGNFPGSPVDLRFFFRLECGKIASLEITP